MTWAQFVDSELPGTTGPANHTLYFDLAENLIAGIVLGQIASWYFPGRAEGKDQRVSRGGFIWFVKKREDWWGDCRVKPKAFDRAIKRLEARNLVSTAVIKFEGTPHKALRLNQDQFLRAVESLLPSERFGGVPNSRKTIFPNGQNGDSLVGETEIPVLQMASLVEMRPEMGLGNRKTMLDLQTQSRSLSGEWISDLMKRFAKGKT